MKTVLVCNDKDEFNAKLIARWLGSFTNLAGIIKVTRSRGRIFRGMRNELKRSGIIGLCDASAFRIQYSVFRSRRDRACGTAEIKQLCALYPEQNNDIITLRTESPNSLEARRFIKMMSPDFMLARCNNILKEATFSLPRLGTFVIHPGICPEYRNIHTAFWAIVRGDVDKLGVTLLQVDEGVDTGPIYAHYKCDWKLGESHFSYQNRAIVENLDGIASKLTEICRGEAIPVDVSNRESASWGHPRLSIYWRWKLFGPSPITKRS